MIITMKSIYLISDDRNPMESKNFDKFSLCRINTPTKIADKDEDKDKDDNKIKEWIVRLWKSRWCY